MDSTSRVKLIIIGLVLAAIVVGYFILAQRFEGTKVSNNNQSLSQQSPRSTPPGAISLSSPSPTGALEVLGQTSGNPRIQANQGGSNQTPATLPKTGIPASLAAVFSVSAIIGGYFLRRFPK